MYQVSGFAVSKVVLVLHVKCFHCEVKQQSCLILELIEEAEADAPPTAPAAAAVLPGDAECDTCPCRRGGVWSSASYWQMSLGVMS